MPSWELALYNLTGEVADGGDLMRVFTLGTSPTLLDPYLTAKSTRHSLTGRPTPLGGCPLPSLPRTFLVLTLTSCSARYFRFTSLTSSSRRACKDSASLRRAMFRASICDKEKCRGQRRVQGREGWSSQCGEGGPPPGTSAALPPGTSAALPPGTSAALPLPAAAHLLPAGLPLLLHPRDGLQVLLLGARRVCLELLHQLLPRALPPLQGLGEIIGRLSDGTNGATWYGRDVPELVKSRRGV